MKKNTHWQIIILLIVFLAVILAVIGGVGIWQKHGAVAPDVDGQFSGAAAYLDVVKQVDFGPRTPGSEAHQKEIDWIQTETKKAGWNVGLQETSINGKRIQNVTACRGSGEPYIILGAHYDSRLNADQDPDPLKHSQPVPGANDGASGVAVLNELARVLPRDFPGEICLVYFDAEDNGDLAGWDWILGSHAYVNNLGRKPNAVVIVDMIGDADLNVYREGNSDPTLTSAIWNQAKLLGYDQEIIDEEKYQMLDDHTPFLQAGIPAVDMIDFDYPYWHTVDDTADKVSPDSLEKIGRTLQAWIQTLK